MAEEKHESDLTRQEKARMRWELIRSLKGKERFAYLWTYYKSYLVLLAILLAGISLLVTCIRNITTRELLSIAVSDVDPETETGRERLEEDLMELLGSGRGREKVTLDTSLQSGESAAMLMKWSVIIGGESTDLLICDGSVWENYQNAFKPWEEVLGEQYGNYAEWIDEKGRLDLSSSEIWQEYGLVSYEPVYAAVLLDSEKDQEILAFLEYLF